MRNLMAFLFVLAIPLAGWAQEAPDDDPPPGPGLHVGGGPGMGGGPGAFWRNPEIAKKLGLTEDQKAKAQTAFKEHRRVLVDLRADLEKKELDLQEAMDADKVDEAKIQALADQVIAARGKLGKDFMGMMLKVRQILTKDQWHQLQEMRREHRGHGKGMGPGGCGMGPGGRGMAPPPQAP